MSARLPPWADLEIFLATARSGTLAGAAAALGVNSSTVQRRIGRLEHALDTRLFGRSQRGYSLTPAGEELLAHVARMEVEVVSIGRTVVGRDQSLEGSIRLTTVDDIAVRVLPPLIHRFRQLHPRVSIEVILGSAFADLSRQQADIALRIGTKPRDQDIIVRHLTRIDVTLYGSRAYFKKHRAPKRLEDLADHALVVGDEGRARIPMERVVAKHTTPDNIAYRANSFLCRLAAIRESTGIGYLPYFMAEDEPGLRRIDLRLPDTTTDLWMLIHVDLRRNARVRALVDFLSDELVKLRPRFVHPD